jgi:hypothetical protein
LLLKLEPVEYKKREKEVLGECSMPKARAPLCLQEAIFLCIKCLFMLSTQHAWWSDVLTKLNHVGNCSLVFFFASPEFKNTTSCTELEYIPQVVFKSITSKLISQSRNHQCGSELGGGIRWICLRFWAVALGLVWIANFGRTSSP